MTRKGEPIHDVSSTTTAGAGAGMPAAATTFCTSACGARS